MYILSKACLLGLLATVSVAAPAPMQTENDLSVRQGAFGSCYPDITYHNLHQTKPYYEKPKRFGSFQCLSGQGTAGCSVGASETHSIGVSKTVSGGASILGVHELFLAGVNANFAYSWSTTDATSVTDNNECPPGGLRCGLMVSPKVVKITGRVRQELKGGCTRKEEHDFEVVAPFIIKGSEKSKKQTAVQEFAICLAEPCKTKKCKEVAKKEGYKACPDKGS